MHLQKDLKKNLKNHVANKHMDKVKLRKDRGGDLRQREKEELEGNSAIVLHLLPLSTP